MKITKEIQKAFFDAHESTLTEQYESKQNLVKLGYEVEE